MAIRILLNGEEHAFDDVPTVSALVETLGLAGRRLAVEVNGTVVPKSEHPSRALADGDRIEVVHAIGGG